MEKQNHTSACQSQNAHCCHDGAAHAADTHHHDDEMPVWRPLLSLGLLAVGLVLAATGAPWFSGGAVRFAWYAVAFLPVGLSVMAEAWESAREGDVFSEFMLMSVASVGAFCIGEYPEAVAVMVFYCIGEALQDRAVSRARGNIASLMAFRPDMARVVEDGQTVEKRPEDVKIGHFIEVRPGERVPLDGTLVSPAAAFNTAALTGESMPRTMEQGAEVLAGMIAVDSVVRLQVTRPAGQSAMARILSLVEDAATRKAPAEQFIRRFARIYTPTVVALAALTVVVPWLWSLATGSGFLFSQWLYRALIFLVISCPCALVISIPLGYFGGIGAASRRGILFKGGNYLDAAAALDTVVFDKTGTLTTGQFAVQQTEGLSPADLAVVAAIEQASSHPIARAIALHATTQQLPATPPVSQLRDEAGYGLSATVGTQQWLVGTPRLLRREGITMPPALADVAETVVACACDGRYRGHLLLADTPKKDAKTAISSLSAAGIATEMLSGDKQALAQKVARQLGISTAHGDLLPQGKVARIEALKAEGRHVAFVGDGINDAPVLALSDVGIAMGALGSDMAVETADVVIQTDQPSRVAEAIAIGRHTRTIVKQNIALALGIKVAVMALGVAGLANLWEAVFADVGVALLAVLNAMRAGRTGSHAEFRH